MSSPVSDETAVVELTVSVSADNVDTSIVELTVNTFVVIVDPVADEKVITCPLNDDP